MSVKVIKPGLLTTIQDLGRLGWQAFGVPVGGAMDPKAVKLVNILLGNHENTAVIEMTWNGATFEFYENTVIAIWGADMTPTLNQQPIHLGQPISIRKGDVLAFSHAKKGMRCYLGIKGGFDVPNVLHSKSTNLKAGFGGFMGRKLEAGDRLAFAPFNGPAYYTWGLSAEWDYFSEMESPIRFIRGRQYEWFTETSKEIFTYESFTVKSESDRMGYRLSGPAIKLNEKKEMITEGTSFGSIQIPPDGQPIILMADRQPTGGYPKIGEVISIDLPKLSQMGPGSTVHFKEIMVEEAQSLLLIEQKNLNLLKIGCEFKWKDVEHVSN